MTMDGLKDSNGHFWTIVSKHATGDILVNWPLGSSCFGRGGVSYDPTTQHSEGSI